MLRTKYSEEIEKQMKAYFDTLNEKDRRGYTAIEAMKLGHGGQNYISSVMGAIFKLSWLELMKLPMVQKRRRTGSESLVGVKRKSSRRWKISMKFSLRF